MKEDSLKRTATLLLFIFIKLDRKFRLVLLWKVREALSLEKGNVLELCVLESKEDAAIIRLRKASEGAMLNQKRVSRNGWEGADCNP